MRLNILLILLMCSTAVLSDTLWAKNKPLRILTEPWAPFSFEQGGEVKGLTTDVVRAVFKEMNIPIALEVMPWVRGLRSMELEKADGIYSVSFKPEREQFLIYPKSFIFSAKYRFYSKAGGNFVFDGDLSKIHGNIGAIRGYSYTKEFWAGHTYHIDEVNTLEQNFKKLFLGRIDAFPAEQSVANLLIKSKHYENLITTSKALLVEKHYYLAFRKSIEPKVVKEFDKAIKRLRLSGRFKHSFYEAP